MLLVLAIMKFIQMNVNQRRMMMTYFVTEQWLKDQLNNHTDLVIVDVRAQLNDAAAGKKAYTESHIQHAVYLDLKAELSGEIKEHGGSHPLPEIETFAKTLGNIGVDEQTTVIIYSDENDMFSARMWWLLHYLGHTQMYMLTGGYQAWVAAGNKVTKDISVPIPKTYEPNVLTEATVDMSDVKNKLQASTAILIDSRAKDRYLGKVEPLYKKRSEEHTSELQSRGHLVCRLLLEKKKKKNKTIYKDKNDRCHKHTD